MEPLRNPSRTGAPEIEVHTAFAAVDTVKVHVSGNLDPNRLSDDTDQWQCVWTEHDVPIRRAAAEVQAQMANAPLFASPVPITTGRAEEAYDEVIRFAGANLRRDAVDERIVSDVVHRTFQSYLHSQSEVGGWPELRSAPAPLDSDQDGIPDAWEERYGLEPADPTDGNGDLDGDGYTNLEQYLADLVAPRGGFQLPGDCNGDGLLDVSDAVCIMDLLFLGSRSSSCGEAATEAGTIGLLDWQADGGVDLSDGVALLQHLFGGGPSHVLSTVGAEEDCVAIVGCESRPECD